jgi:hypothetical protein
MLAGVNREKTYERYGKYTHTHPCKSCRQQETLDSAILTWESRFGAGSIVDVTDYPSSKFRLTCCCHTCNKTFSALYQCCPVSCPHCRKTSGYEAMKRHQLLNTSKDTQPSKRGYATYKNDAINRYNSYLKINDWLNLIRQPCIYCGGYDNYNGIDRVDNAKGYEVDNCVSCCKICNFMKGTDEITEFMSRLQRISQFYQMWLKRISSIDYREIHTKGSFANRRSSSAKEREIPFTISYRYFDYLVTLPCVYCNDISTGLDRIDNTQGYIIGNIAPSCCQCNVGKNDLTFEEFYSYAHNMTMFREGLL